GERKSVVVGADLLLLVGGGVLAFGNGDRVARMVTAVGTDQYAAAHGQAGYAERGEEGVQQARVIGVLDVLDVELPVVGQGLHEAAHDPDRLGEHALDAAQHVGANVLLDRRRVG